MKAGNLNLMVGAGALALALGSGPWGLAESDAQPGELLFPRFQNGDINGDRVRDLSDAVALLSHLVAGGPAPASIDCRSSSRLTENGDANADGKLDATDAVSILRWLFLGGPEPAPACGLVRLPGGGSAHQVFVVETSNPHHLLYTDPNTGGEIKLGGFSGLVPSPGDPSNSTFTVISDRGPNIDFPPVDATGKAFPVPDFSPRIMTVRLLRNGAALILRVDPLKKPNGDPLTGIPSACNTTENPIVDFFGNPVPRDPDGLDVEGITTGPAGSFWICEEYAPSVARVAAGGRLVLRLVPRGAICGGEAVPTLDVLPAVLTKRRANRGLEGITLASSGLLYTILQRPLSNPSRSVGNSSRNIRLLEIDVERAVAGEAGATRQLLYVTEDNASQQNVFASDIFSLSPTTFLVTERRTDKAFTIDIGGATDISGLEDASGNLLVPYQPDPTKSAKTTIEMLTPADLAALGIQPVAKTLLLPTLIGLEPTLEKVEGACVSGDKIVLTNDNDFNLSGVGDISTSPFTPAFQVPANLPKVVTVPLPSP